MSPPRNIAAGPRGPVAADGEPLLRPLSPRSVIASLLLGMHPPRRRGRAAGAVVRAPGHRRGHDEGGPLPHGRGRRAADARRAVRAGRPAAAPPARPGLVAGPRPPPVGRPVGALVRPPWLPAGAGTGRAPPGRRGRPPGRASRRRVGSTGQPPARGHTTRRARDADRTGVRSGPVDRCPAPNPRRELFGLAAASSRARALLARLEPVTSALEHRDDSGLGEAFAVGAAALQQIRRDPLLPPALAGSDWPGAELRAAYSRYQAAFAAALAGWFAGGREDQRPSRRDLSARSARVSPPRVISPSAPRVTPL